MSDENFPGNPFAKVTPTGRSEADLIAKAIQLLAFEVRTSNLIAAATPVDQSGFTPDQLARSQNALAEARKRLGRAPASNVDGYLQSKEWRDR